MMRRLSGKDGAVQAGKHCQLAIAANKQDLAHRSVTEEEAQQFAAEQGAAYFQTSAKTGQGLEELFSTLLASVLSTLKEQQQPAAAGKPSYARVTLYPTSSAHAFTLQQGAKL